MTGDPKQLPRGREWEEVRPVFAHDEIDVSEKRELLLAQLRRLRKRRGLTQKELAERMNISQARVSAIETGTADTTAIGTVANYLNALGAKLKIVADFGDER